MSNISKLAKEAQKILHKMQNGKTYTAKYVCDRFDKAASQHPTDQLIGNMRDVLHKVARSQAFFSENEIAKCYNEMYGFAGGMTAFRDELGDLLPDSFGKMQTKVASNDNMQADSDQSAISLSSETELSKAFEGIFNLTSGAKVASYSDSTIKKAERVTKAQLVSHGMQPDSVKAVSGNQHYLLCVASFATPSGGFVDVKIPVQIMRGMPAFPDKMIVQSELVDINKHNLYLFVKDEMHHKSASTRQKFADERGADALKEQHIVVPEALRDVSNFEDALVAAATSYTHEQIKVATNIVSNELAAIGNSGSQIKIASSNDKALTLSASIKTPIGITKILVPVEFHNGRAILPSKFAADVHGAKNEYDFCNSGLSAFIQDVSSRRVTASISREASSMDKMSYHELVDQIINGVTSKDYKLAEDALDIIGNKYNESFAAAFDRYSSLMKSATRSDARSKQVEAALRSGVLVKLPTSIEPYCPKLGLPLSKVAFDDKGRPVPMRKNAQSENAEDSTVMTMTSKIFLS